MEKARYRKMKLLLLVACLMLTLAPSIAHAQLKEGGNYIAITPQATQARSGVEVTEFFWYGCPHCYALDPVLNKWLKKLSGDVNFRRVPALFPSGKWAPGAKLFFALEAIGEETRVHSDLFEAIHTDALNYTDEAEMADWLAKKGVDRAKFSAAYNSAAVQGKLNRAQEVTLAHSVRGVPTVVVGGKYLTSNTMAGSDEALPGVIEQLISKLRADLARAK